MSAAGALAAPEIEDRSDRFAVVGAGFCGLGMGSALTRAGIEFDILEADTAIGGNWHHGVYETVHIISSRRTTQYGDWPMPDDWPDFPSAEQMLRYLNDYAAHWGLDARVEFSTRVTSARPNPDGTWCVQLDTGRTRKYRGLIAANGHHWKRRWPDYPGEFDGETIHSKDYKDPSQLEGKRVLVIGGGNSACDIAVEAARFARASHISLRRGYWFLPKTLFGVPSVEFMKPWLPVWAQRRFLKAALRVVVGKYEDYGLQAPDHEIFEKHPTINTELLHFIRHGRIQPHADVRRWMGGSVQFVDGSEVDVDMVVCATGYDAAIPFLSEDIVAFRQGVPQLVNGVCHREHANLYVFGFAQARYGAGPLITAGAEALAEMIRTQERLKHPIGALLERLGGRPPDNVLVDPNAVLRAAKLAKVVLPRLPALERVLMREA